MWRVPVLALIVLLPYAAQSASPGVTTLYGFTGGGDGANPYSGLLGIGKSLYGTTYGGGAANYGTVFQLTAPSQTGGTWTETVIHSFAGAASGDGGGPLGSLLTDKSGNLYGTTKYGGTSGGCGGSGCGTVFLMMPPAAGGTWTATVLHNFAGGDGAKPYAGLAIDANGALYGTTYGGGGTGNGTVFMLTPPSRHGSPWRETVLHNFAGRNGQDGALPTASVLIGPDGTLYGTTDYGGAAGLGAVYQLKPPALTGGAWTETLLHSFAGSDGNLPYAGLVMDHNGVLYGATYHGGAANVGVVYQLTPPAVSGGAWTETVLYNFRGEDGDGSGPFGGLTLGTGGVLFGVTYGGGTTFKGGTVFKLTPPAGGSGAWTETVLYGFTGPLGDGSGPFGGLVLSPAGLLYGTTQYGGPNNTMAPGYGTVFQMAP